MSVKTFVDYPWAEKGHEIALYQFEIKGPGSSLPAVSSGQDVIVEEDGRLLSGKGGDFKVIFDCQDNILLGYERKGKEYILNSGLENFTRARMAFIWG